MSVLWIRICFGQLDADPDPGGQKNTHKNRQSEEISGFEVLNVLSCG
jgi:hypothetical protein